MMALLLSAMPVIAQEPPPTKFDGSTSVLESQLAAIAEAALIAQNQTLVNGDVEATLTDDPLASLYQEAVQDRLVDTLNLRIELAKHKIAYAGFRTELTVKNVQITGAKAMMEASEYTVLDLVVAGDDPLAPKTTEYVRDHLFTFVSQDNQWKLSSDQLLNVPGPVTSEEDGYMPIPAGIVPLNLELPPVSQDDQDDLGGGSEPRALATLDRPAIVDYAYTYWDNYNSAYRDFSPNDCTNFISQAVRDGGWTDVPGWYRSTSAWWYNVTQSWTWINPHYWFWFTHDRPRGTPASNLTDLELGDILQIDFDRDGYMDHSMIVTYKDCDGTIYLTYHSTNTLNRSIWDIYNSHPNANYYGWCLLSSFD
jgi:hypothetical protein